MSRPWRRPVTQYADLFMRDFPGDTGEIPSTTRVSVSASPDIIPSGPNAVPNYLTFFANNYSGPYSYFQNVQQNVYNYIYVRAFNLFPLAQTGTIALYYAPSSLLLAPANWINNTIPNANGSNVARITSAPTQSVAVGDSPFYWQPTPLPPQLGHYCLISQVVTTQDPNPIPSGSNLVDFARWVADHPGIAWRNVAVVSNLPAPSFSGFQGIENTQQDPALFAIAATCTDIPDGTTVGLVCPMSGPIPPINLSATVGPANQTKTNPKTNVIATTSTLPGSFKSVVQLTATLPSGVTPPPDADITVSNFIATTPQADLEDIAIDPEQLRLDGNDLDGNGMLLLLGDFTYEFRVTR